MKKRNYVYCFICLLAFSCQEEYTPKSENIALATNLNTTNNKMNDKVLLGCTQSDAIVSRIVTTSLIDNIYRFTFDVKNIGGSTLFLEQMSFMMILSVDSVLGNNDTVVTPETHHIFSRHREGITSSQVALQSVRADELALEPGQVFTQGAGMLLDTSQGFHFVIIKLVDDGAMECNTNNNSGILSLPIVTSGQQRPATFYPLAW